MLIVSHSLMQEKYWQYTGMKDLLWIEFKQNYLQTEVLDCGLNH